MKAPSCTKILCILIRDILCSFARIKNRSIIIIIIKSLRHTMRYLAMMLVLFPPDISRVKSFMRTCFNILSPGETLDVVVLCIE